MNKLFSLGTAFSLGFGAALLLTATAADAAQLRPEINVTDDTIRLGDLFDGAGPLADRAVASAPAPGHPLTFDQDFLQRLAAAYHLDWQPATTDTTVVVTRTSRTVGLEDLRGPVIAALSRRSVGGRLQVEFDNPQLQVVVASGSSTGITVENVYYSPNQSHFSADVVVGAGGTAPQRITLSGNTTLMVEMPVLVHRVNPGDVIGRGDIGWVEFNAAQLFGDLAASEADLLDHTPRRGLGVNTPIYLRDVQAPRMVSRNQLVTMIVETKSMMISTQGKATQDGARGEVIRVVNVQSNRTIEATVTGPNQVTISVPGGS
jgi:flagella basal body P-ring formation protein FlgA